MMKNARRGKNWAGAEKEVMGKRSAKEPANFAVSPIDRYVPKFEILGKTQYILLLRCM